MVLYHASLVDKLDSIGLQIHTKTINSRCKSSIYVYLGTLNYILTQYFYYTYDGIYYVYEIDTGDMVLEPLPTGEQWRTSELIGTDCVKKHSVYEVKKKQIQLLKSFYE